MPLLQPVVCPYPVLACGMPHPVLACGMLPPCPRPQAWPCCLRRRDVVQTWVQGQSHLNMSSHASPPGLMLFRDAMSYPQQMLAAPTAGSVFRPGSCAMTESCPCHTAEGRRVPAVTCHPAGLAVLSSCVLIMSSPVIASPSSLFCMSGFWCNRPLKRTQPPTRAQSPQRILGTQVASLPCT